jgi:O-antigen/teichoic acid export membrane protein
MKNLREKAIRGGGAKVFAQAANLLLRVGSLMVLARLLNPKDFGLVGMVTAITGILNLFRDFGLSSATVQRAEVTDEQVSTLFWINILVGAGLCFLLAGVSPLVAWFYHEPRLVWVTIVLSLAFLFNAIGIQHSAMLQRQMKFTALSIIEVFSWVASVAVGISMAALGCGYWSLAVMAVVLPFVYSVGVWISMRWVPSLPHRNVGIRSMMRFGGTITLNSVIVYIAYNFEKVLLGRFWGAEATGLYGRAYQLINIPTDNLNTAVGEVAFSTLSRVQDDGQRVRSYFLKGYALVLALSVPATIAGAIFANDLIFVVLGPKWSDTAPIFRLLAPTILIFAMINPLAWLLFSTGRIMRSLRIVCVIAPLTITAYFLGLPYGPKGVALAYSTVMVLWLIPHLAWCVHGTTVSLRDILSAVFRPLCSGLVGACVALAIQRLCASHLPALPRLILGSVSLAAVYVLMLLFVFNQKQLYLDLLRSFRKSPPVEEKVLISA